MSDNAATKQNPEETKHGDGEMQAFGLSWALPPSPPTAASVRIGSTGHRTTRVEITDTGESLGGSQVFAYRVAARVYPGSAMPQPGDEYTAPTLSLINPSLRVWAKEDVAEADCNSQGTASNTAYVWMWYMQPGNPPPPPLIVPTSKPFVGQCAMPGPPPVAVRSAKPKKAAKAAVAPEIAAAEPSKVGRWLRYDIRTDAGPEGTRLLAADGQPLRAAKLAVYAHRVNWLHDKKESSSRVKRALGNYIPANAAWRFSTAFQRSLVVWQYYGQPTMICSEDKDFPTLLTLDGRDDIFVNVNEILLPAEYENNKRTVGISVRVIA